MKTSLPAKLPDRMIDLYPVNAFGMACRHSMPRHRLGPNTSSCHRVLPRASTG